MTSYKLKVVAPDKIFFDGETSEITIRTTEGNVGILARHADYVAILPSGPLKIRQDDGSFKIAALSSGVVRVSNNEVTILSNAVEWAEDIDIERAKISESKARDRLSHSSSVKEQDRAELKLKRALNRLNVANYK